MSDEEPLHDTSGDISSEFGEPLPVSYNTRDLIIYALGIGCNELKYVYEDDMDFAAFPTYPIVLAFKGTDTDVLTFPSPAMATQDMVMLPGFKTVLDGERYIEMLKITAMRAGAALVGRYLTPHATRCYWATLLRGYASKMPSRRLPANSPTIDEYLMQA